MGHGAAHLGASVKILVHPGFPGIILGQACGRLAGCRGVPAGHTGEYLHLRSKATGKANNLNEHGLSQGAQIPPRAKRSGRKMYFYSLRPPLAPECNKSPGRRYLLRVFANGLPCQRNKVLL
jgi:hypothetical protein